MINPFCLSSFLTFRYIIDDSQAWKNEVRTKLPEIEYGSLVPVTEPSDLSAYLQSHLEKSDSSTAIFLSSGIDSAILASFLPPGTKAYTIRFAAEGFPDESVRAAEYAAYYKLDHRIIDITWDDYLDTADKIMRFKKAPLHPIEVALYKAAMTAHEESITKVIVGNGADSTFGGLDKLLAKDYTLEEFIKRYTFLEPSKVLHNSLNMDSFFLKYMGDPFFDVMHFLKEVHGKGIMQSFSVPLTMRGCSIIAPFEDVSYAKQLDIARIRSGESKYFLKELFMDRYPGFTLPEKLAFIRPMDIWLRDWSGPSRPEFISNLDMQKFSGEQRWLVYILERFLNLLDTLE